MKIYLQFLLTCLLFNAAALAAPKSIFLGKEQRIIEEPLRFWGGDTVEMEIFSNLDLPEPEVFVLGKALTAPLRLEAMSYLTSGQEEGLYLHTITFTAPELREQQRILLRFGADGTNLLFDVYPGWLLEQVARKAAAYEIQIEPKHAGAAEFFATFDLEDGAQEKRPLLKIIHSEHELVIHKSPQKIIWKTNLDGLDADNPANVLRFEALLDTLKALNKD